MPPAPPLERLDDGLVQAAQELTKQITAIREEAERLFDALRGADLPTITRYVRDNPPSPGAIGWLILIARDRFNSETHRQAARARHAKREFAKAFAIEKWLARDMVGPEYKSKADFARFIVPRITSGYGVTVTERTVALTWLKGVK